MRNGNIGRPKISVIIPIFKVEAFIEKCALSLMSQVFEDVEFIFVDDCTPDESISILERVLARYPNRDVKILRHRTNRGLPAARNTGIAAAVGDYIYHCDSDDFVEPDLLSKMYTVAAKNDADIVWCDYYLSFRNNERYMSQPEYFSPREALTAMMAGIMKYNVWNKLARRTLYTENDISFPEGHSMGEDMTMMMLFLHAKRVRHLSEALYHYVQWNVNALTFGGDCIRHLDSLEYNTNRISEYVRQNSTRDMSVDIAALQLNTKWPFLLDGKKESFIRWRSWFPGSQKHIWNIPLASKRMKFIEWVASRGQFWIIWLHYFIVIKVFYSLFYRRNEE